MQKAPVSQARNFILLLVFALVLGAAISLYANLRDLDSQSRVLARYVGQTFFQALMAMRDWNTLHNGVYVPITPETLPNEYLADPLRDLTTTEGIRLTKINHAHMTRMIATLLDQENAIHVHMTSLTPLRPENAPDPWEREALVGFAHGDKEVSGVQSDEPWKGWFRYMAPLKEEASCLNCHHEHKRVGEIRGGMSVSFRYGPFQGLMDGSKRQIWWVHAMGLCAALLPVMFLSKKLLQNIGALQSSLRRVRQLEGLVPICANCKQIRTEGADADVQASWVPVERFIEDRTNAEFTHGLCPDCRETLYPGLPSGRKG